MIERERQRNKRINDILVQRSPLPPSDIHRLMSMQAWAVEFKYFVYRVMFRCERCGECCRHLTEEDATRLGVSTKPNTTECVYLTNRHRTWGGHYLSCRPECAIYKERPQGCRLFPVYVGGTHYPLEHCPEYKRFSLFLRRRTWRLCVLPWAYYKKPKSKSLIDIYLKGAPLTRGLLLGTRLLYSIKGVPVKLKGE